MILSRSAIKPKIHLKPSYTSKKILTVSEINEVNPEGYRSMTRSIKTEADCIEKIPKLKLGIKELK